MRITAIKIAFYCLFTLAGVQSAAVGSPATSATAAPKGSPTKPAISQGTTMVHVFTDDRGRPVRVDILQSAGPTLDAFTRRYVREHWHGPPNSSKTVSFDYRLR